MDDSTSPCKLSLCWCDRYLLTCFCALIIVIGQFGHCNQELINLLLSGQATTNVFDGNKVLGDAGMTIHGVGHRCEIGYLTQLEALRYCEVNRLSIAYEEVDTYY